MVDRKRKYIFVTGGVISGLGKGLAAASLGMLLESHGYKITITKLDPYLNVDAGTMNPFQHGEVFVTDDGAETDLDLGHYERFTNITTKRANNWTAGKIYQILISRERRGDFLGQTVQVIPHVTDEIKNAIHSVDDDSDIVICEIGGTVGDIESLPFLEAARQMRVEFGPDNVLFIHVTLMPFVSSSGELKTKPTQHSVKELRSIGIQPDILLCRTSRSIPKEIKSKIALFTNVSEKAVIAATDAGTVYDIPINLASEGLDFIVLEACKLAAGKRNLSGWEKMLKDLKNPIDEVNIGLVGKYAEFKDSYMSLNQALIHGGIANRLKVNIDWIESEMLEEQDNLSILEKYDGILIPGGFGRRGIEGKILAINFARTYKVPFFGICLGMQCAVIEFARNVAKLAGANSEEFDPKSRHKVIVLWRNLPGVQDLGGTMRVGQYSCLLDESSLARKAYGKAVIMERHRHRYEFNPAYEIELSKAGLVISGKNPEHNLVEIVELKDHPWFLGCQFHPEFKSKPLMPHSLFKSFIEASYKKRRSRLETGKDNRFLTEEASNVSE